MELLPRVLNDDEADGGWNDSFGPVRWNVSGLVRRRRFDWPLDAKQAMIEDEFSRRGLRRMDAIQLAAGSADHQGEPHGN